MVIKVLVHLAGLASLWSNSFEDMSGLIHKIHNLAISVQTKKGNSKVRTQKQRTILIFSLRLFRIHHVIHKRLKWVTFIFYMDAIALTYGFQI